MAKRLRCRVGMHSWWVDSALFTSVRRCNDCAAVDDRVAEARLARERAAVGELPPDAPYEDLVKAAVWGANQDRMHRRRRFYGWDD